MEIPVMLKIIVTCNLHCLRLGFVLLLVVLLLVLFVFVLGFV